MVVFKEDMKVMITLIGVLTVLAGLLPLAGEFLSLPEYVPTTGMWYHVVVIAVGVIAFAYGAWNPGMFLFGAQRGITIILGLLVLFGGILPFLQNFGLLEFIPTTRWVYAGALSLIGIGGIVYGSTQF